MNSDERRFEAGAANRVEEGTGLFRPHRASSAALELGTVSDRRGVAPYESSLAAPGAARIWRVAAGDHPRRRRMPQADGLEAPCEHAYAAGSISTGRRKGNVMLLRTSWKVRPMGPEAVKRMMDVWGKIEADTALNPDVERLCWYVYTDGSGGFTVNRVAETTRRSPSASRSPSRSKSSWSWRPAPSLTSSQRCQPSQPRRNA